MQFSMVYHEKHIINGVLFEKRGELLLFGSVILINSTKWRIVFTWVNWSVAEKLFSPLVPGVH